jgi:hypothetical protein
VRQVRMRVLGLVFASALMAAALMAGSASAALPEWGRCQVSPTTEGKYTEANCLLKANRVHGKSTGAYEWNNSTTFEGKKEQTQIYDGFAGPRQGQITTFSASFVKCLPSEERLASCRPGETEEVVPVTVTCNASASEGHFVTKSDKEIVLDWRLSECQDANGETCGNGVGGYGNEIWTKTLKGVLGYIKRGAPEEVGIAWKPLEGNEWAKFACGSTTDIVLGGVNKKEGPAYPAPGGGAGVITAVAPIDQMGYGVDFTFMTDEATEENLPTGFEGGPLQELEGYFYNTETVAKGSKWSRASIPQGPLELTVCGNCNNGEGRSEIRA